MKRNIFMSTNTSNFDFGFIIACLQYVSIKQVVIDLTKIFPFLTVSFTYQFIAVFLAEFIHLREITDRCSS